MKNARKSLHKIVYTLLSFTVIASTILIYVPPRVNAEETKSFKDVKTTDYFYEAVYDLKSRGIIIGYEDQTYRPYQSVTRAEASKILALALKLNTETVENPGFQDVQPTNPFYKYIAALAKAGIMVGFGDNTFKPQEMITRAQMAKILSLGFVLGEENLTNNPFTDVSKDAWYAKYLPALISNQITTGTTPHTFSPNGQVTRGQFAAFVFRSEMSIDPLLIGRVSAGYPVAHATISILNSNGEKILENKKLMTNEYGAIQWESVAEDLPSDFRVVVQGGTVNGEDFSGKLMADLRNFNPEGDTIYVNIVTTIVSAYLDKHPNVTLKEAEDTVMKFLEIPEMTDLPSAMHITGEDFSYELFLKEAANNGGINPYINQLIAEMDNGGSHSFSQELLEGAFSFIAKNLAKGALSYTGGELAGWGLRSLGVNFEEEDRTEEELKLIKDGLEDMKNQLSTMSTQLDAVNGKLGNIMEELNKISHKIDVSSYNGRVSDMSTLIGNIEAISDDLTTLIENPSTNWESRKNKILKDIEWKILDQDIMIHNQLTGKIAGQQPLLTLWKEIVYTDRFLTKEDYDFIETQFDYFKQIQEHMLLLQVEYYHATETTEGENLVFIEDCIDRFNDHMEIQSALIPNPIEENIVVDTKANTMYYSKNIEFEYPSGVTLTGKSRDQLLSEMAELATSNPAEYGDWKPLPASDLYKFTGDTISQFLGTDYLMNNGWPGIKGAGILVPFVDDLSGPDSGDLLYFYSYHSHNFIKEYPAEGFNFTDKTIFPLVMLSRTITPKEYGYEHLQN